MNRKNINHHHHGYCLLQDGTGNFFVPEFTRIKNDAIAYCQAFIFFARELDNYRKE